MLGNLPHKMIWMVPVLLCGASPVRAELVYGFSFGRSNYNVALGGTVDVAVYLNESGSSADPFVLAPGGVGLSGTGLRLNYSATAAAKVLTGASITGNPLFDNAGLGIATDVIPTTATAGFTQSTFFNPLVHGTAIGANAYQLLVGTFAFTAESTPGVFSVVTSQFDSGSNTVTGSNASLDSVISNATATITVGGASTVPEPSTLAMACTSCLVGLMICWRRARPIPTL